MIRQYETAIRRPHLGPASAVTLLAIAIACSPVSADEPSGLRLNVATSAAGRVRVALLDGDRKPIEGYSLEDCDVLSGDYLAATIRWRGSETLPGVEAADELIARVEIESGSIWAFSFSR